VCNEEELLDTRIVKSLAQPDWNRIDACNGAKEIGGEEDRHM
jgi:hypothetical protein